ncbi:MAG: HNH endonuclease signature motif containing protein [Phycicoccus sp.]
MGQVAERWSLEAVRAARPAQLAELLAGVSTDDVGGLSMEAAEGFVVATQKVMSWAAAMQAVGVVRHVEVTLDVQEAHAAEVAAERDARGATAGAWAGAVMLPQPQLVAAASLAPLLNISPRTMRTRMERAHQLLELPTTFALAWSGVLEPWRADVVVSASTRVGRDRLGEFEARLYQRDVTGLPKPRLVERANRAAAKADREGAEAARVDGPRRRRLRVAPGEIPGLMRWTVEVPDDTSRRLYAVVEELAQEYLAADAAAAGARHEEADESPASSGDRVGAQWRSRSRRTVDAARVDALTDLALGSAQVSTVVHLVVPADTARPATLVTRPAKEAVAEAAAAGSPLPTGSLAPGSRSGRSAPGGQAPPTGEVAMAPPGEVAMAPPGEVAMAPPGEVAMAPPDGVRQGSVESESPSAVPPDVVPSGEHGRPDRVLVDLMLGRITPATLAAGALERELGLALMSHLEVAGNPFTTHRRPVSRCPAGAVAVDRYDGMALSATDAAQRAFGSCGSSAVDAAQGPLGRSGWSAVDAAKEQPGHGGSPATDTGFVPDETAERVWFVDGLVEAPGTSGLLPAHIVAILADPDTAIRVTGGPVGSADGVPARRRTYRPGKALAEKVRARDVHCRFPGCSVPAVRCHLDHVIAYPEGETVEENLHALCPAHHGFKHHAGWALTMTSDGTCAWTAPTGRCHVTEPGGRRQIAA